MPDPFDADPEAYERLLAGVLLGDQRAENTLVSRLAPIIRRIAARFARANPNLREVLIQEVWVHLCSNNWRVLQQWDRSHLLTNYIAVVASNKMRDHLRRRPVVTDAIDPFPDPPDPDDPERLIGIEQLRQCLEGAKSRLSETHRQLIHLRHELGLTYKEIANQLGRTIGYVSGTLSHAERYLREEIRELCEEHLGDFPWILPE